MEGIIGPNDAVQDFLADNPEWIPDARSVRIGDTDTVAMSTEAVIAFIDWLIKSKRCGDVPKARAFRDWIQKGGKP